MSYFISHFVPFFTYENPEFLTRDTSSFCVCDRVESLVHLFTLIQQRTEKMEQYADIKTLT